MTKKLTIIVLALVLLVAFSACQPTGATVKSGKMKIVVTYSVLGSLVKELVGDMAEITVSIPNGLDPHEWEPSAKDIEAINKADLIIQNGLGLEINLESSLGAAKSRGIRFFNASEHITVRHVGPGEGIPSGDSDQNVGAPDPHIWTDPVTMKDVINALSEELKKDFNLDVSVQAAKLDNRLTGFARESALSLTSIPEKDRKLVTGHESMGYFAQRFNFKLVGVIIPGLTSQAGVSASNLAELKKIIQENQVKVIFTELGTSPAVARAISEETGASLVELNTHALPSDGSYFTFIQDMVRVISNALKPIGTN